MQQEGYQVKRYRKGDSDLKRRNRERERKRNRARVGDEQRREREVDFVVVCWRFKGRNRAAWNPVVLVGRSISSTLLSATKVRSHPHFIYYFVIMTSFWTVIILASIDLLVNCHVCFTLFSRDPFLGALRGVMVFTIPFQLVTWSPNSVLVFHRLSFPNKESHLGFYFLFCFPLKIKQK